MKTCYTAIAMDVKSLDTLEFPIVLDLLAGFAAFSASKELARALKPGEDLQQVQRRQLETTEARKLLSIKPDLTIGGAHDVRDQVIAASRGVILEPIELLDIKSTLISARMLRRNFIKDSESYPSLTNLSHGLEHSPGLIDAISKTLDPRGEVLDSASPKLASLRSELKVAHDRLISKLQRMISDPKIAPMLQEPIITQRDGRFVIPLQADFKGRIKSVVHDQSASGATLFIEPLQIVDLNNQVRELELAERDEIRRILADLSQQVGDQVEIIVNTVEALARLDLAFAKARYAEAIKANEPILKPFESGITPPHPGSTMRLLAARHPLLDPDTVVPIDLSMDEHTYALVITGPNTGGKTVSLKTAGLLTLMALSGLHIPAASGSELSVFDAVFADIGDEQSIEQSLSTFSSHISNIIHILERASTKSLVLLDELGAGTDPQEGAALARAILDSLLSSGVTTLVATHYPDMKTFAHATSGVLNASVEFDMESLRPTFHLTIGLPGRSNALSIARRLGLDQEIIDQARTMVAPEDLRAESLLDEIHHQRDMARKDRAEAEEGLARVQALEAELAKRLAAIDDQKTELLQQAGQEVEKQIEAFRQELTVLRRQLAAAAQPLEALKAVEAEVDATEDKVSDAITPPLPESDYPDRPFLPGDRVHLRTIDAEGVITSVDAGQAEVQVGRLRVRAKLDELSLPVTSEHTSKRHRGLKALADSPKLARADALHAPPLQLNLRGRMVDEALDELDRHLDAAYLAGLPFVHVIHGKGTGRLRSAVRRFLKDNPYVSSFEPGGAGEGGDGMTIVRLASD